jgi:NAD+ dependent glucose-6-phosphate dehydrogenase
MMRDFPGVAGPILVTGAAGLVGGLLVDGLLVGGPGGPVELRRTDRRPGAGIVVGDLLDPAFAAEVMAGTGAVVHLAADADPERTWADLRGPNADMTVAVLDAARDAGTPLVVLASSLHAVGGYIDAGQEDVGAALPPWPCCAYGATKVLGEALGRVHADRYGLSVRCLRLGGVGDRPAARSWLGGWLSPGDLVRLVTAALAADVRYGIYHGISGNTGSPWSIDTARADLGYEPVDDSLAHAANLPDDIGTGERFLHLS